MRDMHRRKIMNITKIGKLFGVKQSTASEVVNYKKWRHVP
jgi:hypothetical protein